MKFKATLDRPAWIITLSILLLFTALSVAAFVNKTSLTIPALLPVLLLWLVIIICFVLSPRYYVVYADKVIVRRFWKPVVISRADIRLCRTISRQEIGGMTRYFGVGGLFGYFGGFLSTRQGTMKLYATRQDRFVLLHTNSNRKIMLSPDEPAAFTRSVCS